MPEIICKEITCKHNQDESCLKSVVVLENITALMQSGKLLTCLQYEERGEQS